MNYNEIASVKMISVKD